jgi:3-hydroxyisobutyrate dehydrogenase-like beta-hydroxyacid dehydrogenase
LRNFKFRVAMSFFPGEVSADMTLKPNIGIVGVGLLGGALARRLLRNGWTVRGFDSDLSALHQLTTAGGIGCLSLEECVEGCGRIILSLPDSTIAQSVIQQILTGIDRQSVPQELVILDTTTGDPEIMAENSKIAATKGVGYLDACLGGSSEEAERGAAILMVGGSAEPIAGCRDLLESLSDQVFYLPRPGDGARMKLVTNLVLGLTRAALAEGLSLAEGLELDPHSTLTILQAGPARSHPMQVKGRKMIERDFVPQARLSQHWKDVGLILEAAQRAGRAVPLSRTHDKILRLCNLEGWGEMDNSSVLLAYFSEKITKLE